MGRYTVFMNWKFNIKLWILPQFKYRLNVMSTKITIVFLNVEIEKLNQNL